MVCVHMRLDQSLKLELVLFDLTNVSIGVFMGDPASSLVNIHHGIDHCRGGR